jgi:hypothetical protein
MGELEGWRIGLVTAESLDVGPRRGSPGASHGAGQKAGGSKEDGGRARWRIRSQSLMSKGGRIASASRVKAILSEREFKMFSFFYPYKTMSKMHQRSSNLCACVIPVHELK